MKNLILYASFIALIISLLALIIYMYVSEIKQYNKGICPHCGGKLKYSHIDMCGNIVFTCEKCKNKIYLSWYKPKNINLL